MSSGIACNEKTAYDFKSLSKLMASLPLINPSREQVVKRESALSNKANIDSSFLVGLWPLTHKAKSEKNGTDIRLTIPTPRSQRLKKAGLSDIVGRDC